MRGWWQRAGRVALTSLEQGVVEGWHGQGRCALGLTEVGSQPGRALLQGLGQLLGPLAHLARHRGLCPAETHRNARLQWGKGQNQAGQGSEQPGVEQNSPSQPEQLCDADKSEYSHSLYQQNKNLKTFHLEADLFFLLREK